MQNSSLGGYALGYLLIALLFTGLYQALMRFDPAALKGLPKTPSPVDFWFFSFMTLTMFGSEVTAQSPTAKVLLSIEILLGIGWTVVVFAAVLNAAQRIKAGTRQAITPAQPADRSKEGPGTPGDEAPSELAIPFVPSTKERS